VIPSEIDRSRSLRSLMSRNGIKPREIYVDSKASVADFRID
jgi:hypothetical protein